MSDARRAVISADSRTMPSSLPDARHVPAETSPPAPASSHSPTPVRTSALSPAYPTTPASRPALRHTASSAANLETPSSGGPNRIRSGSLTLPKPPANLGSAFGSSPFSNAWLANPGQARSPLAPKTAGEADMSSYTSPSEGHTTLSNDELNFSTLDYLGLADGQEIPPASISGLREQHQRAIANNGPASRLRATTISNLHRPVKASTNANAYYDNSEEAALARAIGELGMYDDGYGYGENGGYGKDTRPRATTIGALDNPHRRNTPQGYLASIPQSPVMGNMMPSMSSLYGYPPRSRSDRDLNRSRESSASRGPRMSMSSHTSRAGTPDVNGTSTPQMPTRSLWIGNLDVNATSDALLQVFSPYGAIESVRMLPEKVGYKGVSRLTADLRVCQLYGEARCHSSAGRCSEPAGWTCAGPLGDRARADWIRQD